MICHTPRTFHIVKTPTINFQNIPLIDYYNYAQSSSAFIQKQVKLMWTPETLSLFMINHPYLDSLNDVEIYNALKNYSCL